MLAGDMLRAAADMGFPMIGVTLLYREGYFRQSLDATGMRSERPEQWNPSEKLTSSLYAKLDSVILPMFYGRPNDYGRIMRFCIALNGSFYNTQRMLSQYISNAYSADCWGHWPIRIESVPVPAGDKPGPPANRQTG